MEQVDRVAMIVRPKEPYFAWARSLEGGSDIDEMPSNDFGTVYLVEVSDAYQPERVLRGHFSMIFKEQLESWHRDEATWPSRRTFWMFREWFDVQLIGLVFDLGKQPLIRER